MRVLQVIPGLSTRTGGPPVAVVESSLALNRCGVETTVFATDMAQAASARAHDRIDPRDLPAGAEALDLRLFPARWPYRLVFSPELYRAVADRAREFDVVHIHSLFLFPQFAAYRGARNGGVPYVVSPRGSLDPYLRQRSRPAKAIADALWQRGMLEGASALHLTSDEEARLVRDVARRVPRAVIPNGIHWSDYQYLPPAGDFRARWLGGDDAPVVLYLGRLSHKKGLDVLIRAFAIARHTAPEARLVIAGPDDEALQRALEAIAAREGVADRVTFTGMLRGREKMAALAAARAWALPSHSENFGIAVLEAMAAGLPVIVSPGVNIAPEIAAADAGVVCEQTAEAFGREIADLLRDDARCAVLGRRGREFARRYDWDSVAPRLAAMYEQAAA
jgi:glycosyltransferase involved in cell wall biosynthesis